MHLCNDISPTLRDIVAQFDEENQRPSHRLSSGHMPVMEDHMDADNEAGDNDSMLPDTGTWDFGGCDDDDSAYENCNPMGSVSTNYQEVFFCRLGKISGIVLGKKYSWKHKLIVYSYIFKILVD